MSNNKTVWSSDGDLRENQQSEGNFKPIPPHKQTIYLHRKSARRGGKAVTLVKNLVCSAEEMKSLAKRLKQECGTGGTVKGEVIEIQGEHRERIKDVLMNLGYKVKIAGG